LVLAFFFLSSSGIFTLILFTFNFEANHNAILYILVMFGFSTMFLVSFLGWILTSYLDRIYKQSLRRPNYTVARRVGFDGSQKEESC
jgi:hypothetical protein